MSQKHSIIEKPPITNSEEINGFSPSHRWDLQPTTDQFTGKIDRVRQNETLTSVRHPQPPLTIRSRPPGSVQGGHSLTDSVDFVDSVRVREPCSVDSVDNGLASHNLENFSFLHPHCSCIRKGDQLRTLYLQNNEIVSKCMATQNNHLVQGKGKNVKNAT